MENNINNKVLSFFGDRDSAKIVILSFLQVMQGVFVILIILKILVVFKIL